MSSLTTLGVNKNKKAFAPKIAKRNVRKPGSSSKEKGAEKKKTIEKKTAEHVKQEFISEANASAEPRPVRKETAQVKTPLEEQNYTIDESYQTITQQSAETNVDVRIDDLNEFGLTQEEMQINALANSRRMDSPSLVSAPSPVAFNDDRSDCAFRDNRSIVKSESVTPGAVSLRKSMSRALKEDEGERVDAKDILAAAPISSTPASPMNFDPRSPSPSPSPTPPPKKPKAKKSKGKGKAVEEAIFTPKASTTKKPARVTKATRATKVTKAKASGSGSSIGIGIPSSSGATAITIGAPSTTAVDEEESLNKKSGTKRKGAKKFDFRLPENLKTLDDVTTDPAKPENLERPMSAFTKDIDGIVSKHFKELELARFAEKRKLEEASSLSPEELEAVKKHEEEEAELATKKRKIAQEKEAERRKKEMDGTILAESANALQVRLINGQIVLDTDSLTVERTENDIDYGDGAMEVVEENSMTKKVNSHTYGKRQRSVKWGDEETELFYDCVSQFGTDFEMISMVMPGRTRAHIRAKFNREEKLAPKKITEYLITKRKPLDLSKYEELAGITLEAVPEDFHEMQLA